jgi:protein-S-isoprenylcysteine O-methyltransferase Ste14
MSLPNKYGFEKPKEDKMPDAGTAEKKKPSYRRLMIRSYLGFFALMVTAFIFAGRIDYWQGWLYFAVFWGFTFAFSFLFAGKQDLVFERVKPGPGVKWWDKIFFVIYVPLSFLQIFVGVLDAGRYHFSPQLPIYIYIISLALVVGSYTFTLWAMWVNNFFSSRVRIQTDRGQYVITEGPYHYIRHPGYAGALILLPASALLLGSLYALIPALFGDLLMIVRTYLEDRTLQKELPGYADYAQKTRYLLIPGIW